MSIRRESMSREFEKDPVRLFWHSAYSVFVSFCDLNLQFFPHHRHLSLHFDQFTFLFQTRLKDATLPWSQTNLIRFTTGDYRIDYYFARISPTKPTSTESKHAIELVIYESIMLTCAASFLPSFCTIAYACTCNKLSSSTAKHTRLRQSHLLPFCMNLSMRIMKHPPFVLSIS